MDTTDVEIIFDSNGVCSHCITFEDTKKQWNLEFHIENRTLEKFFSQLKKENEGRPYDCLIGLSGGVDSTYLAYLVHKYELRPLCIHLDNGWNSELAVANIHRIVEQFKFELYTYVIDWEEFRDLQRSFFKADVIDIEMLSDHAIFGEIMRLAKKFRIKNILSGTNIATESIMPRTWVHRKQDLKNIKSIHRKFGDFPMKTFPGVGTINFLASMHLQGHKITKALNYTEYNKAEVKRFLIEELGWRDYGGKHYESIFTKFYQAHILPTKFGVDKRRAHLSSLICSEQLTRAEALSELNKPLYGQEDLKNDFSFVCKKLGFTSEEMNSYLARPAKSHYEYGTDEWVVTVVDGLRRVKQLVR
jgi:N-acetyl sugar amidotransferase